MYENGIFMQSYRLNHNVYIKHKTWYIPIQSIYIISMILDMGN